MNRPDRSTDAHTPTQVKTCCADAYSSDLVGLLLGDSYHPGGLALTRELARAAGLRAGEHVLDVAAGRGTTALMLAQEYDVRVEGVDLSEANVALANGAATEARLDGRVGFRAGDAERLPYADARFDVAVCECALCTFPDKAAAAAELARVLRPGGRLGLTDVVVDRDRLPAELTSLTAWVACIADARSLPEYAHLLQDEGMHVTLTERHDHAMVRMIEQIRARIDVLRMTSRARAEALGLDFTRARSVLDTADDAASSGVIGYAMLVAEKPNGPSGRSCCSPSR